MKKFIFFSLILIIFITLLGLYYYFFLSNNCHLPIKYSIDNVDSRFKISQKEVQQVAQDTINRWNSQSAKELFIYDLSSNLKINLIYDWRQQDLDKINAQIEELSQSRTTIENYQENYEKLVADYQQDLASYNDEVAYWNAHSGAQPEVYQRLENDKRNLQARRQDLIEMAKTLNLQARGYNEDLTDLKNEITTRQNLIVTQGIYDSQTNSINIYTFGNKEELRLVLMHEFGHALGLGHGQNPTSIMYELLDQQDLKNPRPTNEDIALLNQFCNLNYSDILNNFQLKLVNYFSQ